MKRWSLGIMFLALALVPPVSGAEMSWDEQLREMGYYIYHISGLNAMNALNLSRNQIAQLEALARKVEAVAPKPPPMKGGLNPGFAGVRETYQDLTAVLMKAQDVPPPLKVRVGQARTKESQVIRASLKGKGETGKGMKCEQCHSYPDAGAISETSGAAQPASFLSKPRMTAGDMRSMGAAHYNGILGHGGIQLVHELAPQVDEILSDGQKQIMEDFACCLVPPAELSNPVRAGQAEVSENNLKMLRDIRSKPQDAWDSERPAVIERMKRRYLAAQPGLKEQNLQDMDQKLTDLFDRARKMTDAEFEVNKESLCAELKKPKSAQRAPKSQSFKTAMFLLMPGTTQIYDALLKRPDCK